MKFSHPLWANSTALDAVDEASGAPCYFVNGALAEGYHACDVKSPVSSCCPSGYTCSSNALCVLTAPDLAPDTVSRGACTEPRWNGNSCGGNCLGKNTFQPLAVLPLPPVSPWRHRARCVAEDSRPIPVSNVKCHQTRKMRQGEQAAIQSVTADGSRIVAQAVTRREAASARVTSPR